jgi:hypothetical protein
VDPLRLALLLLAIGEQLPEELQRIAQDALSRGFDAPSLREMARAGAGDARGALRRAAEELGWAVPDEASARLELIRYWASEIVSGQVAPIEGARRIARQASPELGHLSVWRELVGEWDGDETRTGESEAAILEQAALLLADTA